MNETIDRTRVRPCSDTIRRKARGRRRLATAVAILSIAGTGCDSSSSTSPQIVSFTVTVEDVSLAGTIASDRLNGTVPLSPGVFAVFRTPDPVFIAGTAADAGTESIAEDGFPGPPLAGTKSTLLAAATNVSSSGIFQAVGGPDSGPAIFPGEHASFTFSASPGDRLQIETMFVQSDDWFYGFDSNGLDLFPSGVPVSGDVTSHVLLFDAGTEQDTPPGTGPYQKPVQDPTATNVGPAENELIETAESRHPTYVIPATSSVIRVTITPASP